MNNYYYYYVLILVWPMLILATDSAPPRPPKLPSASSPVAAAGGVAPSVDEDAWMARNLEDQGYLPSPEDKDAPRELEFDLEPPEEVQESIKADNNNNINRVDEEEADPAAAQSEVIPVEAPAHPQHEDIEKKAAKISKIGQAEFIGFVDPDFVAAAHKIDQNTVQVKRAQELHFSDSGSGNTMAMGNVVFLGVVTVCAAMSLVGVVVAGVVWHRLHKQHLAAQDSEYPVYGVIGPAKDRRSKRQQTTARGDESMAYNAQLHHYQQTKQKIISMEQSGMKPQHESDESDGEGEEGDYSVYECPGLAPTGDIEVSNPMFEKNKEVAPSGGDQDKFQQH